MRKKIWAVSLVLVMVLSFTACEGEELPSAQEITDSATQALDKAKTYQLEMDVNLDMVAEIEDEAFETTLAMNLSGAFDFNNRKLRMDMSTNMADLLITGGEEIDVGMEMYLIDNIGYTMIDEPGEEPVWEKEELPETYWEEIIEALSQTELQIGLLEVAEVEVIGSEIVGGVDCYVVEITLDMEQLWQFVTEQATLGFVGAFTSLPEITEEILDEASHSYSVKQWIAKDTYFLTKVEIDIAMELTPEDMGFPEEEGTITIDAAMTMLLYNYNQPVSIELPPEALEATQ